jgi:hypothetical protein
MKPGDVAVVEYGFWGAPAGARVLVISIAPEGSVQVLMENGKISHSDLVFLRPIDEVIAANARMEYDVIDPREPEDFGFDYNHLEHRSRGV